jgi:hypothetical protein
VQAHDVEHLVHEQRIVRQLERLGLISNAFQIRPMLDLDSPLRSAISARDQCVALRGVDSRAARITSSTYSAVIDGGRPGRGSSDRPSNRNSMNRAPPLADGLPRHLLPHGDRPVVQTLSTPNTIPGPQRQRLRRLTAPGPPPQLITLVIGQHQHGLRATRLRHTPFHNSYSELLAHETSLCPCCDVD